MKKNLKKEKKKIENKKLIKSSYSIYIYIYEIFTSANHNSIRG